LLEDLRPQLQYLEERELYALLQHAGALPALTLALGKESPLAEYEQLLGHAQRQGSVFREIQVIIPHVIFADHQGKTWSWDQARWVLIQYKKTLSDCAVDGAIT
jgi:hypothetical protein